MKTTSPEWKVRPQIIVVDDNAANLRLLMDLLSYEGYEVRPANSGKLALAAALAAPPDMILLDLLLPDMSGYDICRELKAQEAFEHVPIIILSGLDESVEKAKAFECGAVDYITKPFQHKEILMQVRTHLEIRKVHLLLAEQRALNKSLEKQCEADKLLIADLQAENQELNRMIHSLQGN